MNTLMSRRTVPAAGGRYYQDGPVATDQLHTLEPERTDEESEESQEQREEGAPTLWDSVSAGPEDDDDDDDDGDGDDDDDEGDAAGWGPDQPGDV